MPIYDDTWNAEDYKSRVHLNMRDLTKNHLGKLAALKFEFTEYKAHQQIACHIYERMAIHCFNQYGIFDAMTRPECLDPVNFFNMCLKVNSFFAAMKKYSPETFAASPYSRHRPHLEELGL